MVHISIDSVGEGSQMELNESMKKKVLILLGGGHTHSLLLLDLISRPIQELEIVLVSPHTHTAYSGMFPSTLAGHYPWPEMQIDVSRLAERAGVNFIRAKALHLDVESQKVHLLGEEALSIHYDILSINAGAEIQRESIGVAVKPLDRLLLHWSALVASESLTIVGGGAAGVEVALSVRHQLGNDFKIKIIQRAMSLLPETPCAVQRKFLDFCRTRRIDVSLNATPDFEKCPENSFVLWCTPAHGPAFLSTSALEKDEDGFLLTDSTLRCLGRKNIFAVGDVAKIIGQIRPRAGVFAVRLAKPLRENIARLARGEAMRPVRLQEDALALITRGDRYAVAVRGRLYWSGRWLWYLKRYIDRKFMAQFQNL